MTISKEINHLLKLIGKYEKMGIDEHVVYLNRLLDNAMDRLQEMEYESGEAR